MALSVLERIWVNGGLTDESMIAIRREFIMKDIRQDLTYIERALRWDPTFLRHTLELDDVIHTPASIRRARVQFYGFGTNKQVYVVYFGNRFWQRALQALYSKLGLVGFGLFSGFRCAVATLRDDAFSAEFDRDKINRSLDLWRQIGKAVPKQITVLGGTLWFDLPRPLLADPAYKIGSVPSGEPLPVHTHILVESRQFAEGATLAELYWARGAKAWNARRNTLRALKAYIRLYLYVKQRLHRSVFIGDPRPANIVVPDVASPVLFDMDALEENPNALPLLVKRLFSYSQFYDTGLVVQALRETLPSAEYAHIEDIVRLKREEKDTSDSPERHRPHVGVRQWFYGLWAKGFETAEIDRLSSNEDVLRRRITEVQETQRDFTNRIALLGNSTPFAMRGLRGYIAKPSNYSAILGAMKRYAGPLARRRILEVGSSAGAFLKVLSTLGLRAEGMDTHLELVALGQSVGLPVREGDLLNPAAHTNRDRYDITFSLNALDALQEEGWLDHPIEHGKTLEDQEARHARGQTSLATLAQLTKPGGLSVHEAEYGFPFTEEDVRRAGFDILEWDQEINLLVLRRRNSKTVLDQKALRQSA